MGAGRALQHGCAFLHAAALEAHRRQAASAFGETFRECESIYRFGKGARGRAEDIVGSGIHDAGLSRLRKESVLHLIFWVAQRFAAAKTGLFSGSALQFAEKLTFRIRASL